MELSPRGQPSDTNTMNGNFVLVETSPPFASLALLPRDRAYVLGRSTKCDFVVNHPTVSRRHVQISLVDSSVLVRDLCSCNGTFIDQERIEQGTLTMGQNLRLGSVSFTLATASPTEKLLDSDLETAKSTGNEEKAVLSTGTDFSARRLSPAQLRVFRLLLDGLMEKTIAKRLSLSPNTVHNHIRAIYTAFGVHSRSQLLAAELQNSRTFPFQLEGVEKGIDPSSLGNGG